jgi:hypothetical protein
MRQAGKGLAWGAVVLVWVGLVILLAALRDGSPPGPGARGERPLPGAAPGPSEEEDRDLLSRLTQEKRAVAGELIAGRITLAEAAARFRDINARRPRSFPLCLENHLGRTDEERVCRQVMSYVATQLSLSPGEPDPRLDCLEYDLGELLAQDGTSPRRLPPARSSE